MIKKWTRENPKTIIKAHVFKYETIESQNHDGSIRGTFDIVKCANWVNVVAINENDEVILVKQYRHGLDDITLETPAGAIERGEDPLIGAKRELEEETGYTSDDWSFIGKVAVNPAFMTNECFFYLAKNCKLTSKQNLDPLEEVEVVHVDQETLKKYIKGEEIVHSLTISAIHHYLMDSN